MTDPVPTDPVPTGPVPTGDELMQLLEHQNATLRYVSEMMRGASPDDENLGLLIAACTDTAHRIDAWLTRPDVLNAQLYEHDPADRRGLDARPVIAALGSAQDLYRHLVGHFTAVAAARADGHCPGPAAD